MSDHVLRLVQRGPRSEERDRVSLPPEVEALTVPSRRPGGIPT